MILRTISTLMALLLAVLFEDGFVTSLPEPLLWISPVFVVGVLMYHFVRPNIGCAWLVCGGAVLDLIGLPGIPTTITFALAGGLGLLLARKVFTNRSLYAMMGLGASMYSVAVVVEDIWRAILASISDRPLPFTELSHEWLPRLAVFLCALFLSFFLSRRFTALVQKVFLFRLP